MPLSVPDRLGFPGDMSHGGKGWARPQGPGRQSLTRTSQEVGGPDPPETQNVRPTRSSAHRGQDGTGEEVEEQALRQKPVLEQLVVLGLLVQVDGPSLTTPTPPPPAASESPTVTGLATTDAVGAGGWGGSQWRARR